MTITIKAVTDFDLGTEIGARFYNQSSPTSQVGADVILTQSARVTHYASGSLSDITVSTYYDVDLFLSSGGTITEASPLASSSMYVGADGGVYWLGDVQVELLTATQASIDAIEADTNELQGDDVPGLIATAQADLDIITGSDGVVIASGTQTFDVTGSITGNLSGSVGSLTGHTAQTGDTYALANGAAGFVAIDTVVDAILVDTAEIGTAGAGLTDLGGMSTGMKAEVNAEADTALTDFGPATAADILTTALTEAYATAGAAPTLTEAIFMVQQHLNESSISSVTKTVKKLDGSTTAATLTLDDATTPTSITRAT